MPTALDFLSDPGLGLIREIRESQQQMATSIEEVLANGGVYFGEGPVGCHAAGQGILMFDGSVKKIEDIRLKDLVMGPDGTPRKVLRLVRGVGDMAEIHPVKGAMWRVNEEHLVTLVRTNSRRPGEVARRDCKDGEVTDVSIREWRAWSKTRKNSYKLFRVAVDFSSPYPLPVDPYFLGLCLGDGGSTQGPIGITTVDKGIREEVYKQALKYGLSIRVADKKAPTYYLTQGAHVGRTQSRLGKALHALGLHRVGCGDKFIPSEYKTASRDDRLAILAGLMDTDGSLARSGFDYISKSVTLAEDVAFIARSLGLAAYVRASLKRAQTGVEGLYWRVGISGNTDQIPCRIERKMALPRQQKKSVLRTGFSVIKSGKDAYYGFTLDKDQRYLLDDFTVTHNCGKSFAYLTPSVLAAGRRVVIATAKKTLQDQVHVKDLPAIARAIGPDELNRVLTNPDDGKKYLLATVRKGNGNYACRLLADKHPPDPAFERFIAASKYGDRADYQGSVPPWFSTATAESCVGRGCKYSSSCGYMRLKGDLAQSRMVVVNHHLVGADMYYSHGKMMGGPFDVLIVDEAHKLAEGIRSAFTVKVSENTIEALNKELSHMPWKFHEPIKLKELWTAMFNALPNRHYKEPHTREITVFPEHAEEVIDGLGQIDIEFAQTLKHYGVTGSPSDPEMWAAIGEVGDDEVKGYLATLAMARRKMTDTARGIQTMQGRVKPLAEEDPEDYDLRKQRILENTVAYGSADNWGNFHLYCAPINLGGIAKNYFKAIKSVIITSATLANGDNFDHVSDVVGVTPTKAEVLPPTFDYAAQGFAYVPRDLPYRNRGANDYNEVMLQKVNRAIHLCRLSEGGAFILTTANDELDLFATQLKRAFPNRVFAQGHGKVPWDGDPATVLTQYLKTPNSILVGSKSFWEGVDVVGERLRLVIIAKLPFPIFNDPIVKARERIAGAAAFQRVQLVDMLTDLRQGAGRLIRAKSDRGVVAVLDSRIWEKRYGKQVRTALQFPVTDSLAQCEVYLPKFVTYFQRLNNARQSQ